MNEQRFDQLIRAHLKYINRTPELLSLLYDLDLLPEQVGERTLDQKRMLILTNWHHKNRRLNGKSS